jgi:hypothetical protein
MTLDEWRERAKKHTSGDMVWDILKDWGSEISQRNEVELIHNWVLARELAASMSIRIIPLVTEFIVVHGNGRELFRAATVVELIELLYEMDERNKELQ